MQNTLQTRRGAYGSEAITECGRRLDTYWDFHAQNREYSDTSAISEPNSR